MAVKLSRTEIRELFSATQRKNIKGTCYVCRECKKIFMNIGECNLHFEEGCKGEKVETIETEDESVPNLTYNFFDYLSRKLIKIQDELDLKILRCQDLSRLLEIQKQLTKSAESSLQEFRTTHISSSLRDSYSEYLKR